MEPDEDRVDMIDFFDILIRVLDNDQLDRILQEIKNNYKDDCCPVCHTRATLHEKGNGKRLRYGDDVSNGEWHEIHEVDCPVTLISEMRKPF